MEGVAYKAVSNYMNVPAGSYTIDVFAAGDTTAILSTTVDASNSRYTSVVVGDATGTMSFVNLSDN